MALIPKGRRMTKKMSLLVYNFDILLKINYKKI